MIKEAGHRTRVAAVVLWGWEAILGWWPQRDGVVAGGHSGCGDILRNPRISGKYHWL